jgi:glycosyltransferase involved in cell wall biosynthesis/protein-tyrosine-phosphatase
MDGAMIIIIPTKYVFFGRVALASFFDNDPKVNAFVLLFDEKVNVKFEKYDERIHIIHIKQISLEKESLIKQADSILNMDSKHHSDLIKYIMDKFQLNKVRYLDLFKWMYSPAHHQNLLPRYLYEIYKTRSDLQKAFPDPFGKDEKGLLQWAKLFASKEYEIEEEFLDLPLLGSLDWALSPVQKETVIPSLLFEIYRTRDDLQKAFPDPFGKDEQRLLLWAQTYLPIEYSLKVPINVRQKIPFAFSQSSNFLIWALKPVNRNTHLPNFLWTIYSSSKVLQDLFPDALGKDQGKLLKWAQNKLAKELDLEENFLTLFVSQNRLPNYYQVVETFEDKRLIKGVNLIGYARAENGVAEACRMIAKSIATTEMPFGIINYSQAGLRETDLSWVNKEITEPLYNTNIIHVNADSLPSLYQNYGNTYFQGCYNIGYWFWELPEFPDEWCDRFNLLNEVWVSTKFVQESIQKKAPIPVKRIPPAITIDMNNLFSRKYFGLPENRFLFLAMYDTWSYSQRKNPWAALDTFKKTFNKNDNSVGLVLKVNNAKSFPNQIVELKKAIQGYNNIYLLVNPLSRKEVNSLIQSCDCFVSLHRSEGFGIVIAESMYLGKPVIATNWSGNTDFMSSENSCAVNYKLIKLEKDYGPYKLGQTWAEPDSEHAAYFMKKLADDFEWGKSLGEMGRNSIIENLSPSVVGKMIEQRLSELNLI